MRTKSRCGLAVMLGVALIGLRSQSSFGDSIVVHYDPALSSGNTWGYDVLLEPSNDVVAANSDGFTLYDFQAFTDNALTAGVGSIADWKISYGAGGYLNPADPPTDGATPNLTFLYLGTTLSAPSAETTILQFTVTSLISTTPQIGGLPVLSAIKDEVGQDTHLVNGVEQSGPTYNLDSTRVPFEAGGPQTPLPNSALGGIGLIGLLGGYRVSRRSRVLGSL